MQKSCSGVLILSTYKQLPQPSYKHKPKLIKCFPRTINLRRAFHLQRNRHTLQDCFTNYNWCFWHFKTLTGLVSFFQTGFVDFSQWEEELYGLKWCIFHDKIYKNNQFHVQNPFFSSKFWQLFWDWTNYLHNKSTKTLKKENFIFLFRKHSLFSIKHMFAVFLLLKFQRKTLSIPTWIHFFLSHENHRQLTNEELFLGAENNWTSNEQKLNWNWCFIVLSTRFYSFQKRDDASARTREICRAFLSIWKWAYVTYELEEKKSTKGEH